MRRFGVVEGHQISLIRQVATVLGIECELVEEEEQAKSMTRAELARVMAELPKDWRRFFELLAKTLRISGALGLYWPDLASTLAATNRPGTSSTWSGPGLTDT